MSLITPWRIVKFALQDLGRNFWLTVATVSVLMLTLVSVNMLLSINLLGRFALDAVRSRVDVSVHFRPEAAEERVDSVRIALLSLPEVQSVRLVTSAESLENFSETFGQDAAVLDSLATVGENPFGVSLVVRARTIDEYDRILATLDEPAFADIIEAKDFDDRRAMIGRIESVAGRIELVGFAASLLFMLITLLIVFNTIRVSIYTRREEMRIMRLVGASNGFIRGPFYVQAVAWGLFALILTLALVWPLLQVSQPYVTRFFGDASADLVGFYRVHFVAVFLIQLIGITLISLVTTKLATARYLKA